MNIKDNTEVGLETKLEYLRACIVDAHYEDAMGHLDDLRDSINLRACLRGLRVSDLTSDGLKSLRYTEPNTEARNAAAKTNQHPTSNE